MPSDNSHGVCAQSCADPSNALADTMTQDTRSRLQSIFREVFDDDQLTLADDTSRESLEAWDSLGHIRLISALEEDLGISFTLDEIEQMTSVAQILACITSKG
ncbi:acyl carrier protein [Ideonella sp. A 288]|uniref:acyl carrier protein n=1 Tax=Ideonella sp. A 288 TaxID=1962181 RepID=UPI0018FE7F80|nr:acyl carrier protein [Ideonella sp. A 288]